MSVAPGADVALIAAAAYSSLLFALVALAIGVVVLYWGYWIATRRGYSAWLGLALAFFLGLIGIIILYVLPTRRPATPTPRAGYVQYPPPPGSAPGRPPAPPGWSTVGPPPPWAPRPGQEPMSTVSEAPPASPPAAPSATPATPQTLESPTPPPGD
jgi:hypothetical protein